MRDGWARVPLGTVARLSVTRVPVEPSRTYPMAGVLNEGKGVFLRGSISGDQTSYAYFHRLQVGQLVMRKLTAFEGAIGVVGAEANEVFVSTEFPTFTLDAKRLLPGYMALICKQPSFWHAMWLRSTGTVQRRKRVNPNALLSIPVLLPSVKEQHRTVDLLDALNVMVESSFRISTVATRAGMALFRSELTSSHPNVGRSVPLEDAVEVTMGRQRAPQHQHGEHIVPYLRAANVKDGRLELDDMLTMNFAPEEQSKFSLLPGDVLVTEGCGSLGQVGASAPWRGERTGVICFQNTLLRLRAKPEVATPEFVALWARHAHASGLWAAAASGTNIFHIGATRAARIPVIVPALEEQERIVALVETCYHEANATQRVGDAARVAQDALAKDLLSGGHEIPASYDDLLVEV